MLVDKDDVASTPARLNFDFASYTDDLQSSRTKSAATRSNVVRSSSQRRSHLHADSLSESVSALQLHRAASKGKSGAQQQIYHSSRPVAKLPGLDHPAGLRPKVHSLAHHPSEGYAAPYAQHLYHSSAPNPRAPHIQGSPASASPPLH